VQVVVNGRIEKGMPAFKDVLEPRQIENVYAYVAARGSGELGPGRPAQ
jgi:mono/diheme cytochrome c family protein